jgi:hypothetical protein
MNLSAIVSCLLPDAAQFARNKLYLYFKNAFSPWIEKRTSILYVTTLNCLEILLEFFSRSKWTPGPSSRSRIKSGMTDTGPG